MSKTSLYFVRFVRGILYGIREIFCLRVYVSPTENIAENSSEVRTHPFFL